MDFDKKFYSLDKIVQVILLIIPFVGWLCELLIRLSVALRKKDDVISWVVFVLFVAIGWGWVLCIIDLVYLCLKGHLILADPE